jgi:hypothetical protein
MHGKGGGLGGACVHTPCGSAASPTGAELSAAAVRRRNTSAPAVYPWGLPLNSLASRNAILTIPRRGEGRISTVGSTATPLKFAKP